MIFAQLSNSCSGPTKAITYITASDFRFHMWSFVEHRLFVWSTTRD